MLQMLHFNNKTPLWAKKRQKKSSSIPYSFATKARQINVWTIFQTLFQSLSTRFALYNYTVKRPKNQGFYGVCKHQKRMADATLLLYILILLFSFFLTFCNAVTFTFI